MAQVLLELQTMPDVCRDDKSPEPSSISSRRPNIDALVITYDGLLDPTGQLQLLPFIDALSRGGVRLRVLSFEKTIDLDDADRVRRLRARFDATGLEWTPLRSHERLRVFGTVVDVFVGVATAIRMARARRIHVVHARSYIAGLVGHVAKLWSNARFVFDMRGFWPEERVEMGLFRPQGLLYRTSKRCERFLLDESDHIVVLTDSAKAILRDREATARMAGRGVVPETPITVIPCCADLERFRPAPAAKDVESRFGLENKVIIGNVGTVSKRYMLPEMFRFAFHVKSHRPETQFVYLTPHDPSPVRIAAMDAGFRTEDVLVRAVEPDEIPRWLTLFRLGVFFLRPSYAAKGSSYAELPQFLACGIPVVTNTGVGDVDAILRDDRCSVLVPGLTENDLAAAARQSLPLLDGDGVSTDVSEACRETAARHFALDEGASRLLAIYGGLATPSSVKPRTSIPVEIG